MALRKREIDGEITDGEGAVFQKVVLDALFGKPRVRLTADGSDGRTIVGNVIYVALDPNGGANKTNTPGSDTAIVSFFVMGGCFVVSARAFIGAPRRAGGGPCRRPCAPQSSPRARCVSHRPS